MAHDALGAHARDELGISKTLRARPIQAALASAASFAVGAALPLLVTAAIPESSLIYLVSGTSLLFLALLGGLAAHVGGAGIAVGALRVTFWGALAMAITTGAGALFRDGCLKAASIYLPTAMMVTSQHRPSAGWCRPGRRRLRNRRIRSARRAALPAVRP